MSHVYITAVIGDIVQYSKVSVTIYNIKEVFIVNDKSGAPITLRTIFLVIC